MSGWKVGEALDGVVNRFLTFWLAIVVGGAIQAPFERDWISLIELPLAALFLLWFYQPARIWRQATYASSSIPVPSDI